MAVQFVAHRGESEAAPENTLESFTLAWARGARLIEGDFHLTLDGEVVCMHDSNAGRTCGVKRELAELTLAEIKALDAGAWKGPQWRFTRVPTLAEVLGTMPDYGEIYIELKSVGPIVDRLREIFAASGRRPEQLTFIAFYETTIATVKRLFPAHRAYWLTCNERKDRGFLYTPDELAAKLRALGVDGIDLLERKATPEYIETLHKAGFTFHVWTVDQPERAKTLIDQGVDSITSNRAYALRQELNL